MNEKLIPARQLLSQSSKVRKFEIRDKASEASHIPAVRIESVRV